MIRRFFTGVCCLALLGIPLCAHAAGTVVLKVIAVNPSKEMPQKVQVRAYLPKETKPENIVDRGDLEVTYDTQQGSYLVYGDYDLKPAEVLERSVEIQDIWVIPQADIDVLNNEADKTAALLKNTEFEDRAKFLLTGIRSKLEQIQDNQKNPAPNPERHISDYRDNLKLFESAKNDMVMCRSFLTLAKPLPTVAVWRAILIIVVFLGVLGLGFFLLWHKQLKGLVTDDTFYVPPKDGGKDKA